MMLRKLSWVGALAVLGLVACEAGKTGGTGGSSTSTSGSGGSGAATTGTAGSGNSDGGLFETGPSGAGGSVVNCNSGPDDDADADGFTPNTGDCNDCDKNVNPGAVEVIDMGGGGSGGGPGEPVDEDCDNLIDDADTDLQGCDVNLAVDGSAMDGAKAIDICKTAVGATGWGVLEAKWVLADGTPGPANPNFDLGHGILSGFGPNVNVQKGQRMLGVSSGAARQPNDPGYQDVGGFSKGYSCTHPIGFPKESPSCGVAVTGSCYDSTGLEILVRAPTNANGFSFNFNFFTYEWPGYVCSTFNDFFTALLMPFPQGQNDGNITFDNFQNPVSVNNAFVEVCGCFNGPPCQAGGKTFDCNLGTTGLVGTGFGADTAFSDHGSTSWLLTQAPIEPGAVFTLRFVTYDSGDGVLDSTTLVDNFQWIAEPGTQIGTTPIPDPK
ncbi:MAG: choice-of-anchor L domain-containing protein [Polyangiaceae bacterium]|nr:choice-of-anchor L domain-containing protein [Polyangiaceae bacterium]